MKMIRRSLFWLLVFSTALLAQVSNPADYHRPFPAFRIAGSLYFVGTVDLAVCLITAQQPRTRRSRLGHQLD